MSIWSTLPQPFFVLAPMEAVTDVIFRQVVERAGSPDLYMSEFTNATGWVHAGEKAIGGRLVKEDFETKLIAQIWGGEPGDMEQLAAYCAIQGFAGIDINMGCPAKSAVKSGGSALIKNPELAASSIAAAKTAGLPVSVKTRLGYSSINEWRDWLTHLFRQDIVNLTIHLRTKSEMSKVPAHFELIDDIITLRDEIAPQTLLTINGDIENRAHGEELVAKHPGINGIMIGRGVFHDPYCFRKHAQSTRANAVEPLANKSPETSAARVLPASRLREERSARSEAVSEDFVGERVEQNEGERKQQLLELLHYHLNLYDKYHEKTRRPFETLKRFFKIYIRDFDGAADLRAQLMQTKTTVEVRSLLSMEGARPSRSISE